MKQIPEFINVIHNYKVSCLNIILYDQNDQMTALSLDLGITEWYGAKRRPKHKSYTLYKARPSLNKGW